MINIFWPHENLNSISDQLGCLSNSFLSNGIPFIISGSLDPISYNVCIENFEGPHVEEISAFCNTYNTFVGVVVTEFLEIINQKPWVNGRPLVKGHPMYQRFSNLKKITDNVDCIFSVLAQPDLLPYATMFSTGCVDLGGPDLSVAIVNSGCEYDFYFSGSLTPYRHKVIGELRKKGFSVLAQFDFVDDEKRRNQLARCNYNLNIPQTQDWRWLSTMRVLFGLVNQKLTVTYGKTNPTELDQYVIKIDKESDLSMLEELKEKTLKAELSAADLFPLKEKHHMFGPLP